MSDDILAKLEAAEAGSRELDALVAEALGWKRVVHQGAMGWETPGAEWVRMWDNKLPHWSTSVDAALTLRPADANSWGIDHTPKEIEAHVSRNYVKDGHWLATGEAKTDALALCIACLKARARLAP